MRQDPDISGSDERDDDNNFEVNLPKKVSSFLVFFSAGAVISTFGFTKGRTDVKSSITSTYYNVIVVSKGVTLSELFIYEWHPPN